MKIVDTLTDIPRFYCGRILAFFYHHDRQGWWGDLAAPLLKGYLMMTEFGSSCDNGRDGASTIWPAILMAGHEGLQFSLGFILPFLCWLNPFLVGFFYKSGSLSRYPNSQL